CCPFQCGDVASSPRARRYSLQSRGDVSAGMRDFCADPFPRLSPTRDLVSDDDVESLENCLSGDAPLDSALAVAGLVLQKHSDDAFSPIRPCSDSGGRHRLVALSAIGFATTDEQVVGTCH